MDMDTVFWIASCTKMIVGIACMQLVEQGKFKLDDADIVDKVSRSQTCSHFEKLEVYQGEKVVPLFNANRICRRSLHLRSAT
jgi:D-alanyl-D-alanine carboxypeptidase